MPKHCVDTTRQEVAKFVKLEEKQAEVIPFICPKSDKHRFHEDIYPEIDVGFC